MVKLNVHSAAAGFPPRGLSALTLVIFSMFLTDFNLSPRTSMSQPAWRDNQNAGLSGCSRLLTWSRSHGEWPFRWSAGPERLSWPR